MDDEFASFLDPDTGEVATVSRDLLRQAEEYDDEAPDLPERQEPEWRSPGRSFSADAF
jgi:hypothetical protein